MNPRVHIDVFQGEKAIGHIHLPPGQPLEVGREGAGCRIADPAMSRRHFLLSQTDDGVTVEDLGSSGGTFVNGAALSEPVLVASGDRIEAGDTLFVVELETESPDQIEGTTWHVHEVPEGFFVIAHLGLQHQGGGAFAETLMCREDQLEPGQTLSAYVDKQCEALQTFVAELAITDAGAASEIDDTESNLRRLAFLYQGAPVHQWHAYVQREQRVGVAVWTFEHPHAGEREQVRQFLTKMHFE